MGDTTFVRSTPATTYQCHCGGLRLTVMAELPEVITAEQLESMTAAERAAAIDERLVTKIDSLDDRTAKVVARGSAKVRTRLQNLD